MTSDETSAETDRYLYRSMRSGDDALPLPGAAARLLGVRPGIDLVLNADGAAQPQTGGLSVAPDDPLLLPEHRRPLEFGGTGNDPVWRIRVGDLDPRLAYRPDPDNPEGHGFIEPSTPMPIEAFQAALEASRSAWTLVEPLRGSERKT